MRYSKCFGIFVFTLVAQGISCDTIICPHGDVIRFDGAAQADWTTFYNKFENHCQCGTEKWNVFDQDYGCSTFLGDRMEKRMGPNAKWACIIHDQCYDTGRPQSVCDDEFLRNWDTLCTLDFLQTLGGLFTPLTSTCEGIRGLASVAFKYADTHPKTRYRRKYAPGQCGRRGGSTFTKQEGEYCRKGIWSDECAPGLECDDGERMVNGKRMVIVSFGPNSIPRCVRRS